MATAAWAPAAIAAPITAVRDSVADITVPPGFAEAPASRAITEPVDLAVEAPPDSAAAPGPFPAIVAEDSVVAVDSTATAAVEGSTAADSAVEAASMVVVAATAAAVDTGN